MFVLTILGGGGDNSDPSLWGDLTLRKMLLFVKNCERLMSTTNLEFESESPKYPFWANFNSCII